MSTRKIRKMRILRANKREIEPQGPNMQNEIPEQTQARCDAARQVRDALLTLADHIELQGGEKASERAGALEQAAYALELTALEWEQIAKCEALLGVRKGGAYIRTPLSEEQGEPG